MPPRKLTRDPHGGLLFSQLSLEDENDDYRGHNPISDNTLEATLPHISPNEYERSPDAERSLTLDGIQTSDDRNDAPHQIQGYSESEPSALPSPGTASDINRGDNLDVDELPDTLPLPPMSNFNGVRSTPSEGDGINLLDESSLPSENKGCDKRHLSKENWHVEDIVSDQISFSDDDNDNDAVFFQSEGEKSYQPSETEAIHSDSSRAKPVPKRVGKKTLAGNPKATTKNFVPQADESADQGTSKKATSKKTGFELNINEQPRAVNVVKRLYEYRAAQAAEGEIVPTTQPKESTHAKKSGLSSVKRVPKRSFLEDPANHKCDSHPASKTTVTTRKRAKGAAASTVVVNEQTPAPHVNISSATQAEPTGTCSNQVDLYDIESSPEPHTSRQLKTVPVVSPKKKTTPASNRRAASSKGHENDLPTKHQRRSPDVDLLEMDVSAEQQNRPSPKKSKVSSRRIEKKAGASAEKKKRTSGKTKKKPFCDDRETRQDVGRDAKDNEIVQHDKGVLGSPNRKKGPTALNSKKKRVYESNTTKPNQSNQHSSKEIETEPGIVQFDPHTGPDRQHPLIVEQQSTVELLQKPILKADDMGEDSRMKIFQGDSDISDRDLTTLARQPRDPKQIQTKLDVLSVPMKKAKLSHVSIEQRMIQDDNCAQIFSNGSRKVESNKLSDAVDEAVSNPFEAKPRSKAKGSNSSVKNPSEPVTRNLLTPHVYMKPIKPEVAKKMSMAELRQPIVDPKDILSSTRLPSHPNESQPRATSAQRIPLAELKQTIAGASNESQRKPVPSHITAMLHSNSPPLKVQAEDRIMTIDNQDMFSSQEQAIRLQQLHHSKDDVFASNNEQRRHNTSFMDKLQDVQAHPKLKSAADIHPRSLIFAEELSKNKPLSYVTGGLGREQNLITDSGSKRLELSEPLPVIHPKSQIFAREIPKGDNSRQGENRHEWHWESGDFRSQNALNQGVSDSSSALAHRQDHGGNRWKIAVDIATVTVQEKMHAVTQMVLRGLSSKETAINMVVKEYRHNGENIGKKLLRRQARERDVVHTAFRKECDQLTTIYGRSSKAAQSVGDRLSSINTKVSREIEDDRVQSQNLVSDIRGTIKELANS